MRVMTSSVPPQVIPVLDIARGRVVRGVRGERSAYRPIVSSLAAGSDPSIMAAALLARVPLPGGDAPVLYVADLDALQGGAAQLDVLAALLHVRDDLCIWLDAGFVDAAGASALQRALGADAARIRPVYGSESLSPGRGPGALDWLADDPLAILSLDCRHDRPLDPAGLWQRPRLWPRTIVAMTLDRVGARAGPDLALFSRLRALAPDRRWVGAGGVRHADDLRAAAVAGASAWLVASALHDATLHPA
jgi:phosphoribosylformimino-5-aminoimidazole carboxamide ribotide isomerase